MKKTINIENQPVEVNSSMGWLFIYREQFGHDILPDILPLLDAACEILLEAYESQDKLLEKAKEGLAERVIITLAAMEITTIINVMWAMAKNADSTLPSPKEWANQFDTFPVDIVAKELFFLLMESSMSSKNSTSLQEKLKKVQVSN